MILLMLLAAPLGDAARIFGFKAFSFNGDSHVKATPASGYPLVQERSPAKGFLELKESFGRRADLEEQPGSEGNFKPNESVKSRVSDQRSDELLQKILPSLKFNVAEHQAEKSVRPFEPLGHSPGIGHDDPPGLRR